MKSNILFLLLVTTCFYAHAQFDVNQYNIVWKSQSKNASETMPVGGGDIGLNVWVENNDILFYIAKTGTFDENNALLKLGRVRLKITPNPFDTDFKQSLLLNHGKIEISNGKGFSFTIWADVFNPVINLTVKSDKSIDIQAFYENWRDKDRYTQGKENNGNSWKWISRNDIATYKDVVTPQNDHVLFYHKNKDVSVFDATVKQEGLYSIKEELDNPLKNRIFGGIFFGKNFHYNNQTSGTYNGLPYSAWRLQSIRPAKQHNLFIVLKNKQEANIANWEKELKLFAENYPEQVSLQNKKNLEWWKAFWQRSYIDVKNTSYADWEIIRNYNLFRFMLAANAYGEYPTKFNGGLFTYDPVFIDSTLNFTPDFRNWGGGTHTAQNQRLVYWPMLRSGDFEMMKPQFNFYLKTLKNAEARTQFYWQHKGASFTEQIEVFGLPNVTEYGWKRPDFFDKGLEYNAWLEYEWDTVFEFCLMMLEQERYQQTDISEYLPLIESCLTFFEEHYIYRAKQRGRKIYDENGHLVLFPGSAAETYKMAYNANSTLSALKVVLERLLALPHKYHTVIQYQRWENMKKTIPPLNYREINGKIMLTPAKLWERVNNTESPQLYPVFPWSIFGLYKPGLDTAINTFYNDPDVLKFRSHIGWKQDNIFAARLGLTKEAYELTTKKLKSADRRFPAFWGPGFDWVPDHNWGGSAMIGIQEMLLQTNDKQILLFPAWPKDKDIRFKLHAPYQTTIEAELSNGVLKTLKVVPKTREKDVILLL